MYDVYGGTGYFHVLILLCFKNNLYVVKFCVFISLLLILVEYKTCFTIKFIFLPYFYDSDINYMYISWNSLCFELCDFGQLRFAIGVNNPPAVNRTGPLFCDYICAL